MKFCGHSMGTPGLDVFQSMDFMKTLGYDGIEIRVAANGQIDSETIGDGDIRRIRQHADALGLSVACLTPYDKDFVTAARPETIRRLLRVVEVAAGLGCDLVRVYGGLDPCPEGEWFVDNWSRTVSGLCEVADAAAEHQVRLAVETHINTLVMSVRDALRMVDDVGRENIGILLDMAWVDLAGVECGREAVLRAAPRLFHCHVKDWRLESRKPLRKTSCLMGEGTLGWKEVFTALREIGYAGWISDEYEKLWYPKELPAPEIGMKQNLDYVRRSLGSASGRGG
ncbi:MAG: sugar phosphate isomerase/epimerase [Kiritimatiellia bacterium]|nr:sugar phosphate isomerase/epimerase [Kiritimatiellia bacterium]